MMNSKKKTIKKKFFKLVLTSTSHGLPNIFRTKLPIIRFIWLLFVTISLLVCFFSVYLSIFTFLEYNVTTKIRVIAENPMKFPMITICNANPFVSDEAKTLYESVDTYEYRYYVLSSAYGDDEKRKLLGFSSEKMFYQIAFNGKTINKSEMIWFYDYYYGNCFYFNSGLDLEKKETPIKYIDLINKNTSLKLEIFTGFQKYNWEIQHGIRLLINDQSIPTNIMSSDDIFVPAGVSAQISLKKIVTKKKPKPFSACSDSSDSELFNLITKKWNKIYRQKDCFILCIQKKVEEICGCYYGKYPKLEKDLKICPNLEKNDNCRKGIGSIQGCCSNNLTKILSQMNMNELCKDECIPECYDIKYEPFITFAKYPSKNKADQLKENINFQETYFKTENFSYENMNKGFLEIKIGFDDLEYTLIEEAETMNFIDFISNVGGTMGLWLGISLLSFLEIFEFLIYGCIIFIRKKNNKVVQTKSENENKNNEFQNSQNKPIYEELKEKLLELIKSSTSHGLPNIFRAKLKVMKIIWTLCFITSIIICGWSVILACDQYYNYDTISQIRVIDQNPIDFPMITICNTNPLISEYSKNLSEIENYRDFIWSNFTDINKKKLGLKYAPFIYDESANRFGMFWSLWYNWDYTYESLDFVWFFDYHYGNCIKFNSGFDSFNKKVKIKTANILDNYQGLWIEAFLGFQKFNTETRHGLRLLINDQSISINTRTNNEIFLKPGYSTIIYINKVVTKKLPKPFNNCDDLTKFSSKYFNLITKSWNKTYKQNDCFTLCLQNEIIEKCNCYWAYYPNIEENNKPCSNSFEYNCYTNVTKQFWKKKIDERCLKQCPLECDSITYESSISYLDYPTMNAVQEDFNQKDWFLYLYFQDLNELYFDDNNKRNDYFYKHWKRNFCRVQIKYKDLKYTEIKQYPFMSSIDFLGNIGGLLGIWVGISFLSFGEIIESIVELAFILYQRKFKKIN